MEEKTKSETLRIFQVEPLGRGGIAHYSYCLNCALLKAGATPTLITANDYELRTEAAFEVLELFRLRKTLINRLGLKKVGKLFKGLSLVSGLFPIRKKIKTDMPDVIHFQGSLPFADWLFSRFIFKYGQKRGIKILYTAHNVLPHEQKPIHNKIYSYIYKQADAIIVHSKENGEDLAQFEPEHKPAHVVPHGDYTFLNKEGTVKREQAREKFGIEPQEKVILFFGAIRPYKGLDNLINACGSISDDAAFKILIVGNPLEDFAKYDRLIEKNGLADKVIKVLEYVPTNQISEFFVASDMLVLPYKETYQSGVIQLGLAFGLPLICSDTGSLPDSLADGKNCLLFEPNDERRLASLLLSALTDDELLKLLSANSKKLSTNKTWPAIAAETLRIYSAKGQKAGDIKTIWIFNHYAVPPGLPGGTRHYDLARELVGRGYEVYIFAAGFSHRERKERKLSPGQKWRIEDIDGVKFVWIRTFAYTKNNWKRFLNMVSFRLRAKGIGLRLPGVEKGVSPPDLVIGSSVHLFAVSAAAQVAKHFRARFFMEVRDIWPQTLVDLGVLNKNHPVVLLMRKLEMSLYRAAEYIITPLPGTQNYFNALGVSGDRIIYLPQGTPVENLERKPKESEADDLRVGYVGAFGPADDVGGLLNVAKLLVGEKIRFLFVGNGDEKDALENEARLAGLTNVEFLGAVPKEKVPQTLENFDVCLARYYHAAARQKFGVGSNKLVDYMAAGKPIVFAGEMPNDVVAEIGCGISVKPHDPQLMVDAIKTLQSMKSEDRQKMGLLGKDYVAQYHSIPRLVDRLEGLWLDDNQKGKQQFGRHGSIVAQERD